MVPENKLSERPLKVAPFRVLSNMALFLSYWHEFADETAEALENANYQLVFPTDIGESSVLLARIGHRRISHITDKDAQWLPIGSGIEGTAAILNKSQY